MITYSNTNIKGFNGHIIQVHPDFVPYMDKINSSAARLGIMVHVTNSFRKPTDVLTGTVVTPAKMSNHLVGMAIDWNLEINKVWYNKIKIELAYKSRIGAVYSFIQECKSFELRYGGDFNTSDPIHFDNGLNVNNPDKWHEIYNSLG